MVKLPKSDARIRDWLLAVGVQPTALDRWQAAAEVPAEAAASTGRDVFAVGPIVADDDSEWLARMGVRSVSPAQFRASLASAVAALADGEQPRVRINSPGGDVFSAAAIKAELDALEKYEVRVDGLAASAAGILAINAPHTEIAELGMLMLHRGLVGIYGNAVELRKAASILDDVDAAQARIMARRGMTEAAAMEILTQETWFSAAAAAEAGLVDAVFAPAASAADGDGDGGKAALQAAAAGAVAWRRRMRARTLNGGLIS